MTNTVEAIPVFPRVGSHSWMYNNGIVEVVIVHQIVGTKVKM